MGQSDDSSQPAREREETSEQQESSRSGGPAGFSRRQLLLLGAATVGLFAVSRRTSDDEENEHEIRVVLNLNAHTLETADFEGHMETLHPESPRYNESESRASDLIQNHNVTVELTVQSITVDNRTAEAEVVRTVRGGADDSAYQDVREWITYELQRYDEEWRIYNRTVRETSENPPTDG